LQLDPGSGIITTFAIDPYGYPMGLRLRAAGNLLVADPFAGVLITVPTAIC